MRWCIQVLIAGLMDSHFRGVQVCCRTCAGHPKSAAPSSGRRDAQHQTRYHAQQLSSAGPHASEYTGVRPRAIAGVRVDSALRLHPACSHSFRLLGMAGAIRRGLDILFVLACYGVLEVRADARMTSGHDMGRIAVPSTHPVNVALVDSKWEATESLETSAASSLEGAPRIA
jgi:hypothetical protein